MNKKQATEKIISLFNNMPVERVLKYAENGKLNYKKFEIAVVKEIVYTFLNVMKEFMKEHNIKEINDNFIHEHCTGPDWKSWDFKFKYESIYNIELKDDDEIYMMLRSYDPESCKLSGYLASYSISQTESNCMELMKKFTMYPLDIFDKETYDNYYKSNK